MGTLAYQQMFPSNYLTFDMAVDLRSGFETELAVHLGTRIEVGQLADGSADFVRG